VAISETEPQVGRPHRSSYVITEEGEIAFQRLLRAFWFDYKPPIDPFIVAVSFMDQLPRDELIAALRHHVAAARSAADGLHYLARHADRGRSHAAPRRAAAAPDARADRSGCALDRGSDRDDRAWRTPLAWTWGEQDSAYPIK